jgi:hypothetical protein
MTLRNDAGHTVFGSRTDAHGVTTGRYAPGDTATMRLAMKNWLAPSEYRLTPSLARAAGDMEALDLREDLATLTVHGTTLLNGVVDLPHEIEVARA